MSPTPDSICLLCFIFIPSYCFKMSQFMGVMFNERSETRFEVSSSGLPVAENVEISWTPASVLCVWCFNGNINYSQYFRIFSRS